MHASNQANKEFFFFEKIEKNSRFSHHFIYMRVIFIWKIMTRHKQRTLSTNLCILWHEWADVFVFFRRSRYLFDFCCNALPDAFPYPFLPLCVLIPYWCLWRFYLFVYGFFLFAMFHIPSRIGDPRKKLAKRWLKWY